jgi:hypothetical protein
MPYTHVEMTVRVRRGNLRNERAINSINPPARNHPKDMPAFQARFRAQRRAVETNQRIAARTRIGLANSRREESPEMAGRIVFVQ